MNKAAEIPVNRYKNKGSMQMATYISYKQYLWGTPKK